MKLDDLTLTGSEITLRRTEEIARTSVLRGLNEQYDEHARLVFMFDVSGSMGGRVAASYTDQYVWTTEKLDEIRRRAHDAVAHWNQLQCDPLAALLGAGLTEEDAELIKLADDQRGPNGSLTLSLADDEEVKARVVRHDLIGLLGVEVDWAKHTEKAPTRIELVKKLAKSELANRFKKFPKSKVTVIPFGDQPKIMFDGGKPDDLWTALESLCLFWQGAGGGTEILAAIGKAVECCRKSPSPVGVHHLILVSDGEDYAADSIIGSWVPNLKASGVVLDYIHIGDRNPNGGMAAACKALGGECVTVNSEREFTEKFVEAVQRKMLPPATA